jgi:hypothetical protein
MAQQVTFVTVGKLKGKTIAIGPDRKFQFINGEMKVDEEDAGLVARALRFYGAFPKGDSEPYHLAACAKLGIDPKTGAPVSAPAPVEKSEPEPEPEPEVEEEELELVIPERMQNIMDAIRTLDEDDEASWTSSGKPSLPAVKQALGGDVSRSETDAAWKAILNET